MTIRAALLVISAAAPANAEGELGPMFGGSIVASHGEDTDVAGFGAELVLWYGRLGVAAEASRQWTVDDAHGPQVGAVAASVRVLAFDQVVPSLLDSRDVVDLGIELQGIVERAWWNEERASDPVSYGFGVAVRLRGANDDDRSNLLAESRLFVRVMRAHESDMSIAARDTMPSVETRGVGVIVGLGALWGPGRSAYVARLRRDPTLDSEWLVGR